jgi:hypothetical protein
VWGSWRENSLLSGGFNKGAPLKISYLVKHNHPFAAMKKTICEVKGLGQV